LICDYKIRKAYDLGRIIREMYMGYPRSTMLQLFAQIGIEPLVAASIITIVAALSATEASGQVVDTTSGQTREQSNATLEEVIVTAQRRPENLQDIPMSITAFDSQEITEAGMESYRDIAVRTPGVDVTGARAGSGVTTIRGIGPIGGGPTTAYYLDDVPITGGTLAGGLTGEAEPAFIDTARVEVLKGPQGTLYGNSSMGGAIKIVSNLPDASAFSARISVGAATTQDAAGSDRVAGTINVPLVQDILALRISADYRLDGGYIDNVSPVTNEINRYNANTDRNAASHLALAFKPDDTLSIIAAVLYQRLTTDAEPLSTLNIPGPGPTPTYQSTATLKPLEMQTWEPETSKDTIVLPSLTINKHFAWFDLTSITGYYDRHVTATDDVTPFVLGAFQGAYDNVFNGTLSNQINVTSQEQITQEVRISSRDNTAPLKWTAGIFYQNDPEKSNDNVYTTPLTTHIVAAYGPGMTLANLIPGSLPNDTTYIHNLPRTIREEAIFGEVSYDITNALGVTVGARAFQLSQDQALIADGLFNGGPTSNSSKATFHGVDPRYVVNYKITPDHLVYVSAAEGFRPGQVNAPFSIPLCAKDLANLGLTSVPDGSNPDTLWNYELGSKNTFFEKRLRVNVAAFQMNWTNIQLSVNLPDCGQSFQSNVGKARVRGGEASVEGEIIRDLTVGVSMSYLETAITELNAGVTSFVVGDQLPNTPKQWYSGYFRYAHVLSGSVRGILGGDYEWRGNSVRDSSINSDQPYYRYQGWGVGNLNAGVEWSTWDVRMYLNNVFNGRPTIDYESDWGLWRTSTLRPRTLGINFGKRF
jgi:iron complex outermembrane recepter protein